MRPTTIYRGTGECIPYDTYMALINEAFGFDGLERDFRTLLPKLYRPGRAPQDQNYVVCEDGVPVAVIGAYSHAIRVCGNAIPCRGIGNVAVAETARGHGYMKDCMHRALLDMVQDGVALSTLGGRRQRYRYFGYEKAGICYTFSVTADNLRHTLGDMQQPGWEIRQVGERDVASLAVIRKLSESGSYAPIRPEPDLFDILSNWKATVWVALREGNPVGYLLREPSGLISELRVAEPADLLPLLTAGLRTWESGGLTIRLPEQEDELIRSLATVAEGCQVGCSMSYCVLQYKTVCEAFFALKATYAPLADGDLSLHIHGLGGEERLCLSVREGVPSVRELSPDETAQPPAQPPAQLAAPAYELSHEEAMRLLFAPLCPERRDLPPAVQTWLPLPIWMYRADEV